MHTVLAVEKLHKSFNSGSNTLAILKDVSFSIQKGEIISIVGPSGSGKTTLLGLLAGLDYPTEGSVSIEGKALNNLSQDELAALRNQKIGFVFQNFQLLPTLTALENVMVPMELKHISNCEEKSMQLLEQVGLKDRANHYPKQLSGGEQQRVAIARAFGTEPLILFADEPTGNLDEETGSKVEKLLFDLNKKMNTTLVLVTHDMGLAQKTQKILRLQGGKLVEVIENTLA